MGHIEVGVSLIKKREERKEISSARGVSIAQPYHEGLRRLRVGGLTRLLGSMTPF